MTPKLWLVGGPNGAGKSTVVQAEPIQRVLPGIDFWNPDSLAKQDLQRLGYNGFSNAPWPEQQRAFIEAANRVEAILKDYLARGVPVGVETVLSSDKYKPLVESVTAAGGFVGLIYITVNTPEMACERVAQRVRSGGHGVPEDKIRSRWSRSLANLGWFAERASQFFVFDNSNSDPAIAPALVAYGSQGRIHTLTSAAIPAVVAALAHLPRTTTRPKSSP